MNASTTNLEDADDTDSEFGSPLVREGGRGDDDGEGLLPVRMLNEYAYCPRLFHLMHVDGVWADNAFTADGRLAHRRVDRRDQVLPDPHENTTEHDTPPGDEGPAKRPTRRPKRPATPFDDPPDDAIPGAALHAAALGSPGRLASRETSGPIGEASDAPPVVARSVTLASAALGIVGKLDLVSTDGAMAVPVDTKRGSPPDVPERAWEPERVQLMAQGLLLRENGFRSEFGFLYFAEARTRVLVRFTPELESRTRDVITQARAQQTAIALPAPLDHSPKCVGCSLHGICLPDETLALRLVPPDPTAPDVRRLYPARDDALPLYIQEQGATVGKRAETLTVSKGRTLLQQVPLKDIGQLVLCGNIGVSAQALHLLCEAGIPIVHLSAGHWFYGITQGITLRHAYGRIAQYEMLRQPSRQLALAREFIRAKTQNQRTLLRRNSVNAPRAALASMARLIKNLDRAADIPQLLGHEGSIAAHYFRHFPSMLKVESLPWRFDDRNRRPPRDPVNAMLSFGYALLVKECTLALLAQGLDPWLGFLHQLRHGRPALALDLMEEFRPLIVDSAVLTAINTSMVAPADFVTTKAGCIMGATARKALITAYEARLDQLITHPIFAYRCSWRAAIRLQAALLARYLRDDIPAYIGMTTR